MLAQLSCREWTILAGGKPAGHSGRCPYRRRRTALTAEATRCSMWSSGAELLPCCWQETKTAVHVTSCMPSRSLVPNGLPDNGEGGSLKGRTVTSGHYAARDARWRRGAEPPFAGRCRDIRHARGGRMPVGLLPQTTSPSTTGRPTCVPPDCPHAPDPHEQARPSGTARPRAQGPAEALQDHRPILRWDEFHGVHAHHAVELVLVGEVLPPPYHGDLAQPGHRRAVPGGAGQPRRRPAPPRP